MADIDTVIARRQMPVHGSGHGAVGWWAMVCTVVTEAALFAYLILSYFYLASIAEGRWLPGGEPPELSLPLVMTVLLLLSSAAMWWAERGIGQGNQGRLRWGLLLTWLLGAAFLAIQFGWEWPGEQFGPTTGAYGSLFFTITGLHAAHLAVGLLMNLWVQLRAWAGHFTERRHLAVSNVALYWHFVDAVWLVVLSTLYISPYLA